MDSYQNGNLAGRQSDPLVPMQKLNPNSISTDFPLINQPINVPLPVAPIARPLNFSVNEPFVGGQVAFVNPTRANIQLQNVVNAYLNNPNANQIIITIGTNTVNLNQPSTNPAMTVRQLLTARGRAVLGQLRAMGVPLEAFPNNWLQFAPGTVIGTTIRVR